MSRPARLRCGLVAVLLLGVLVASSAAAQDVELVTRYTGRTVVSVEFQAPDGVATDELRYLIDQEVGEPYNPRRVGRSLELLFRLRQFDDVQARVREVDGGVAVTFVVVPSPRIRRIILRGVRELPDSQVRVALSRGAGDPYVATDEIRLASELEGFYRDRGYLEVEVVPKVFVARRGGRVIELSVHEGPAYRVGEIRVLPAAISGYEAARIEELLRPRVRVGRIYRRADLEAAVNKLLGRYRKEGFVEVRILAPRRQDRALPVDVRADPDTHTVSISLPIEAGPLVRAEFVGVPARRQRAHERVIGLEASQRASEAYADDAGRQLLRSLRRRGYFHAEVVTSVETEAYEPPTGPPPEKAPQVAEVRVLRFEVEQGPLVVLYPRDFEASGNEQATTKKLLQGLQDASPEVIGHRPLLASLLGLPIYRRHYTEGAMEEAASVLRDWYRARGFLDVQLDWQAAVPATPDGSPGRRAYLSLTVDEGVRTFVEKPEQPEDPGGLIVDIDAPLDAKMIEGWKARVEGKPFNPAELEELVREARSALAENGFIDARVEAEREFSDDRTLVRLRLVATTGPAARFGQIIVRDNRFTHVGLIRREVADKPFMILRTGDVFQPSAIAAAQRRLLRTGLFDGVVLRPAQSTGRVRDVEIRVNERARFTFVGAMGITWPDDGPRVSGEVRARNLDGRGLSVFLRGRASLDWRFLIGIQPRVDYRASLGVELPLTPGVPLVTTISAVANEELDEPTHRVRRSSVGVSLAWRGSEWFALDLRAEVQWRLALRVDSVAQLAGLADMPEPDPSLKDYRTVPLFGFSATIDRRDDRFNPRSGLFASLSVDTTPGRVTTNAPAFGRATARVVGLIPIVKDVGLTLEAAGGVGWSYDEGTLPPVEWRFRMGGTGTLRGFPLDQVGPTGTRPGALDEVGLLHGDLPERRVPVGGNAFYRYTIELAVPIVGLTSWRFAIFHDGGNALIYGAVPDGIDAARSPGLAASVGVGLRRLTPIGPLRLDVAVVPAQLGRVPELALGEWIQLHFAVGAL